MSSNHLKHFLGCSEDEMYEVLGPPSMAWLLRGEKELVYEIGGVPVTFTMNNGRVIKIDNQIAERRGNCRVHPVDVTPVRIRACESIFMGVVEDISDRGIAVVISVGSELLKEHTTVVICTILRTSQNTRKSVIFDGKVHSRRAGGRSGMDKIIILFTESETHSRLILREFINYHIAVAALKCQISLPGHTVQETLTVKSDRCGFCPDQLCEKGLRREGADKGDF